MSASSPIAKAQHVCSFDKFTAGGTRNFNGQIYYFGLLLLKAPLPGSWPIYLKTTKKIASGFKSPGYKPSCSFPCLSSFYYEVLKLY